MAYLQELQSRVCLHDQQEKLSRTILFLHELHHHQPQAVPVQYPTHDFCLLLPHKSQVMYLACCPFAARFLFSFL